jgi:hypothetical protein
VESGAFWVLWLYWGDLTVATYDAAFNTLEECIRMGELHLAGVNGPVLSYACHFALGT